MMMVETTVPTYLFETGSDRERFAVAVVGGVVAAAVAFVAAASVVAAAAA
jgi:3-dehydroquinate synthetase